MARAIYESEGRPDGSLWATLVEVGVADVLLSPMEETHRLRLQVALARELSRVASPVPFTAVALASGVLATDRSGAGAALTEELLSGSRIVGACLPDPHGDDLSVDVTAEPGGTGSLSGRVALAADLPWLQVVLLWAGDGWWAVDLDQQRNQVCVEELDTLDRTRPVAALTLDRAPARRLGAEAGSDQVACLWWALLAAEATGAAETAFEMAVDYAKQRRQFGQPIGAFQAIQHKLVDDLIALEAARSALEIATASGQGGRWPAEAEARVAKIVAGDASRQILTDAIQVHGAMGNTWEHDIHLLLRRAKAAESTGGSPRVHREVLGELLAERLDDRSRSAPGAEGAESLGVDLSTEDAVFVTELRDWLDARVTAELRARLNARDRSERIRSRRDWQATLADAGWAGIHWPREHGGREASLGQQMLYHYELARRGLPPLIGNRGLSLIGQTIIAHGTEAQRREFVEATRRADILWASGLSEREAGSDLAGLRTRGVVDGEHLVLNGHKIWTTSAHFADWLFCLVRTDPAAAKHDGITCVLVPMNAAGVTVRPIRRITGDPDFNEVFLDDVRVPLDYVVGPIDQGWRVARTTLSYEHMTNFLGTQMRLAVSVDAILERSRRLGTGVALRAPLTDAWIDTQLLRAHGLRNVSRLAAGEKPGPEGSILKLFGQELEKRLFELGLDAGGTSAVLADRWAKLFLGTRASTVGGGTSEVHRNKLAERVLGLPKLDVSDLETTDAAT